MTDYLDNSGPNESRREADGAHDVPAYAHTMSILRWFLLAALSIFAVFMILTYFGHTPWADTAAEGVRYHCPMHPTYISSQPGDCPICGMSLVPIDESGAEIATAGDGAETHAHESAGEMQMADDGGEKPVTAQPGQYTCPMHPEVISDEPGRCPECGMFLEQVPGVDSVAEMTQKSPPMDEIRSDVPGLVPVTISTERLQLIGLRTAKVARRSLDEHVRLVGFVSPDETRVANVHVRVNGWVNKLYVDQTGQLVEAGSPLLSLYSQDIYQAEQDFLVARDAARSKSGDSTLQVVRAQLLNAARERLKLLGLSPRELAALDTATVARQETVLRSPFSGYVLEKSAYDGEYITPNQNLFTIADLSRIWVLADVYERDLPAVRVGQTVHMSLTAFPGKTLEGKVSFIYPSISEKTRTMKIRMEFENPKLRLRPGMYAEVSVNRSGDEVLSVPAEAVLDGGLTKYAFVVHDGTHFEPREVTVGQRTDDWVEIIGGLHEGEEVVIDANFLIDSESRLKASVAGMADNEPTETEHQH